MNRFNEDYEYLRYWANINSLADSSHTLFGELYAHDNEYPQDEQSLSFLRAILDSEEISVLNMYFFYSHSFNKRINRMFKYCWNITSRNGTQPVQSHLSALWQSLIDVIYAKHSKKWKAMNDLMLKEYNPLNDYNETSERKVNQSTNTQIESTDSSTSTLQNNRVAFGGTNSLNTTGTNSNTNTTSLNTTTGALNDNAIIETFSKNGMNKFSVQDLITKEIDVSKLFTLLDVVCDDIASEICERYEPLNARSGDIELDNIPNL